MLSVSLTLINLENIANFGEVQISLNIYSLQIDYTYIKPNQDIFSYEVPTLSCMEHGGYDIKLNTEEVKDQSEPLLPLLLKLKSYI